ncbi:MAG: hypothetical protein AB1679_17185 [Actinomycetota bacterium]
MKKRLVYGVLVGVTAFAGVTASAATLGGITSTGLGADDVTVASCDTNGVSTSYTTAYNTTTAAGYKVDDITVAGIADACNGKSMKITLVGASNASLGEVTATVAVNSTATPADTSDTVDFLATNKLAEDVQGIHVVISG